MSLVQTLRRETADLHRELEDLPFSRKLAEGRADRQDVVRWTGALLALHRLLDNGFERASSCASLPATLRHFAKSPILEADLTDLTERGSGSVDVDLGAEVEDSLRRLEELETTRGHQIGLAYVVEGSANGGALLTRRLEGVAGDVDAPRAGLRHLVPRGDEQRAAWLRWKVEADALDLSDQEVAEAVHAARTLFRHHLLLHRSLYQALGPTPSGS